MTATSICKRFAAIASLLVLALTCASEAEAQPTQSFARVFFGDGSSSAPSMAFRSETTLGLFRPSSGNIGVRGNVLPHADATNNVGSGSARWAKGFFTSVSVGTNASAWFADGNDPFVRGIVSSGTQSSSGTNDMYGNFFANTLNLSTNTAKNSYGTYAGGTLSHSSARTFVNHYGLYGGAYTGDVVGDGSGWFSGVTGDAEWGAQGDVAHLASLNAAFWGTYDPGAGSPGHVTSINGVHVGQPFIGSDDPGAAHGIWIEDVTAGGALSLGANNMWALRFDADTSGHKFGVRYDGKTLINNILYTWPTSDSAGCLASDGSGSLSFAACSGGSYAPIDAQFVTLATNGTLTNERVLTAGSGISITDGGAGSTVTIAATGGGGSSDYNVACGRLTTESGQPVSTSDRTSQSTLYYALFGCNRVGLYDGSSWAVSTFTERSLSLSGLTSDKNYDVFLYDNSGTLTLELSAAWTNDTTRADAIAVQDGVWVKSGSTTRRLIGTIRTTGTTTTEDSAAKRFVANVYNRRRRSLEAATETADSWSYTTPAWRQSNANSANQLMFVVSMTDEVVSARARSACYSASNVSWAAGVGVNSTSTNSAKVFGTNIFGYFNWNEAGWEGYGSAGYNYLAWLEYGATGCTFYGDAGTPAVLQFGITGSVVN